MTLHNTRTSSRARVSHERTCRAIIMKRRARGDPCEYIINRRHTRGAPEYSPTTIVTGNNPPLTTVKKSRRHVNITIPHDDHSYRSKIYGGSRISIYPDVYHNSTSYSRVVKTTATKVNVI